MNTHHLSVTLTTLVALGLTAAGCSSGSSRPPAEYGYTPDGAKLIVASLLIARHRHEMTSVGDPKEGELLISGGMTLSGSTNTAEIIDATTGQTRSVAAVMNSARSGHVAVRNSDGQAVIFGGEDQRLVPLDSIEVYDHDSETFSNTNKTLLEPRVNAAVAVDGDRAVIVGGGDPESDTLEVWSLSPLERIGQFDSLAGTKREDVQLVLVRPGLYFLYGGLSGQPNLWIDIDSGTATPAANTVRHSGTAFSAPFAPGAALVVGGFTEFGKAGRGVQIVRPSQQAGEEEFFSFELFKDRTRPSAIGAEEGIYVLGGHAPGGAVTRVERVGPEGGEIYPDLFGAPQQMEVAYLGVDHIVATGGLGPDTRPVAIVNILIPAVGDEEGIFNDNRERDQVSNALDQDIDSAQSQLRDNQNTRAATSATLAQREAELRSQIARGQSLQAAIDAAEARITQLKDEIQTLQARIPTLQSQLTQAQNQGQQSAAQLRQLQAQRSQAQQQLLAAQGQLSSAQGTLNSLNTRLNLTRQTIIGLNARFAP